VDDLDVVWRTNDLTLMSFGLPHQDMETFRRRFVLPWQTFYGSYGLGGHDALMEVDRRFWQTYRSLSKEIRPFPATLPLLLELKGRGLKVAVVTQTKREPLREQIGRFGLKGLIDVTVGAEDADELKPSPKPVQEALRKLGVAPSEAVFTGDMAEDVLSGKRAGVTVVSIIRKGSYHSEEMVRARGPDFVVGSMAEVERLVLGEG
jgi:HAD superfamily hydrolase (TIGR01509 family)